LQSVKVRNHQRSTRHSDISGAASSDDNLSGADGMPPRQRLIYESQKRAGCSPVDLVCRPLRHGTAIDFKRNALRREPLEVSDCLCRPKDDRAGRAIIGHKTCPAELREPGKSGGRNLNRRMHRVDDLLQVGPARPRATRF